jgi:signal transduction histidine kinase
MAIYRILQESLNNISKHSRADRVHLIFRKVNGEIELYIQDTGQGFDLADALSAEEPRGGTGLSSMRERTENSGETLLVESDKGEETRVRVSWPVINEDKRR